MLSVKTYGKLYVAGEYQVLEKEGIAIVLGLNRYMELTISNNDKYLYQNDNLNQKYFDYIDGKLIFNKNDNEIVKATLKVVFNYLSMKNIKVKPFLINIVSNLESENGQKYGFGSSSAVITGFIKVITKFFNLELSNEQVFKLAVIAQLEANKLTSGGDLAASIYGTMIFYQRYDLNWLLKQDDLYQAIDLKWPDLLIKEVPTNLNFGAIWTKTSYHTPKINLKISNIDINLAKDIVISLKRNLLNNDIDNVFIDLNNYQNWFNDLFINSNIITVEIENALKILKELNLAGKISGAGGGDSIIFLYEDNFDFTNLIKRLEENNLELIKLEVIK